MIFKRQDELEWHQIFALFPRETEDNTAVWLQKVYRKWNPNKVTYSPSDEGYGTNGAWEYKL